MEKLVLFTTDSEWDRTKSGVQWCAAFWAQGPNQEKIIFVGHAITNTYINLCFCTVYYIIISIHFTHVSLTIIPCRQQCQYWGGKTYLK
jgi:hypothetical protein